MRIAETASHHPFQDHELGISWHIPEKEYLDPQGQPVRGQWETDQGGERGGSIEPLTPIPGTTGGIGRTPVPVAESTRQPEREVSGETPVGEGLRQRDIPTEPERGQGELSEGVRDEQEGERPQWALPKPTEPRRPPGKETNRVRVPPQGTEEQEGEPTMQEYPTPQQRLIEADKRRRKRLAALARDHIVKLREERQRMAYGWLEEYFMRAASAKLSRIGLSILRAEYVHKYNRLLD